MKITISGFPGSGKTTLGELFSKEYHIPFFSVGDLRGEYAKKRGITLEELNKLGKIDSRTDTEADKYQKEWALQKTDFILDGRLSYYFIPDSIKIFLTVVPEVGAKRIFLDQREDQKRCRTIEEVVKANKERCQCDMQRYAKIYGISNCYDEANFDIVVDTTNKTPKEIFDLVREKIVDKI